jgi:hypothetical protein
MADKTVFKIEINGGKTQQIETETSQYGLAAIASLALCEYEHNDEFDVVKIWCENLLPEYGPYFYAFDGTSLGFPTDDRKW